MAKTVFQSSLYRAIENLAMWWIPVGGRTPNTPVLRHYVNLCSGAIDDALIAIHLGLETDRDAVQERLDCIDTAHVHLTRVKTIVRILKEYSDKNGHARVLSNKQFAHFSICMNKIYTELGLWRNATARQRK